MVKKIPAATPRTGGYDGRDAVSILTGPVVLAPEKDSKRLSDGRFPHPLPPSTPPSLPAFP